MSAPTVEYTEKFVRADGQVHDFLTDAIEDDTVTEFVPRCQSDRKYPPLRVTRRELRDDAPPGAAKCPWCDWRERVHL